jgi:hypothetical protein
VSRIFLYRVQAFHHITESFVVRLEIAHKKPLYQVGFEIYRPIKEALAAAYAYRKLSGYFRGEKDKQKAVRRAFKEYLQELPSGYKDGLNYQRPFKQGQHQFAEETHRALFPHGPDKDPAFWTLFSYAFRGLGNVKSRVNYLVPRPLAPEEREPMPDLDSPELD